jgi:hypothetical protein
MGNIVDIKNDAIAAQHAPQPVANPIRPGAGILPPITDEDAAGHAMTFAVGS